MTETQPLFDSGVNFLDKSFVGDIEKILSRAEQLGLVGIMNIASDVEESLSSIDFINSLDFPLYTTAGVHPHHAKDVPSDWLSQLNDIHQLEGVKAIGETGLDFNRNYSPAEQQVMVFEGQLELATSIHKPLYLHERDAHQKMFEMLTHYRDDLPQSVLHCFTGDKKSLYRYLDLDLYIGITGWVCDERRGLSVMELIKDIPSDRLLLETDAPYLLPRTLSPKPKSRRNEPCYLAEICQQIAAHIGKEPTLLARETTENAARLFKLDSLSGALIKG